jgi:biotin carboxylase
LPDFVEIGHDYPADIAPPDLETIEENVRAALNALGLTWGPSHVELRLAESGPTIIEVNPRLAGGFIPELVRLASGIDLIEATVKLATGSRPNLEPVIDSHACIRFSLPDRAGILAGADGLDESREVPGIVETRLYSRSGSQIEISGDFRDRIGHVTACNSSLSFARHAAQYAHSKINLHIQP